MKATLKRDFTAHETAYWVTWDDEVVFRKGDIGTVRFEDEGVIFYPDNITGEFGFEILATDFTFIKAIDLLEFWGVERT